MPRRAWLLALLALAAFAATAAGQRQQRYAPQRYPDTPDFPTGPAIGERLPDFTLRNQRGEAIDFHADRGGHKAAVVFQRSAVW
jgi:cytochrome oxidase Cu insertion factor (SCO1/SenC/PrrC family)